MVATSLGVDDRRVVACCSSDRRRRIEGGPALLASLRAQRTRGPLIVKRRDRGDGGEVSAHTQSARVGARRARPHSSRNRPEATSSLFISVAPFLCGEARLGFSVFSVSRTMTRSG